MGAFPLNSPELVRTIIMKSYNSLYKELCSFGNLYLAYRKARKNKSSKWYVKEFEKDLERNIYKLQYELESHAYNPKPLKQFVIRDPKTRVISASDFRDRVAHHAICNIIEPIFDKAFIHDSYANRKGKGALAAVKRFDASKRKISYNGKILPNVKVKDSNQVFGYVLKADIKHYFDSVDHEILMQILARKINDKKVLWLIRKVIENHTCKIPGNGMPIGNLTSQFFANVYLNELDFFVKHRLKAKYYVRYVDDFVILDRSEEKLELYKEKTNEFLKSIKLALHPEKSKIIPLRAGINFLGYRIFYSYKLLKKSNKKLIANRIRNLVEAFNYGVIAKRELYESLNGWNAYAMHANTYKLRSQMLKKINKCAK